MTHEKGWTRREAMANDLREVLSTEAGRRIVGGIFYICGKDAGCLNVDSFVATAYREGMRAVANAVANDLRAVDPRLIVECEMAYERFLEQYEEEKKMKHE